MLLVFKSGRARDITNRAEILNEIYFTALKKYDGIYHGTLVKFFIALNFLGFSFTGNDEFSTHVSMVSIVNDP